MVEPFNQVCKARLLFDVAEGLQADAVAGTQVDEEKMCSEGTKRVVRHRIVKRQKALLYLGIVFQLLLVKIFVIFFP